MDEIVFNNANLTDDSGEGDFCSSSLVCPRCESANMEMDALMNLVCPNCGYSTGGGST
jgi:hypothetical protein